MNSSPKCGALAIDSADAEVNSIHQIAFDYAEEGIDCDGTRAEPQSLMLDKITIEGFKSIRKADVELRALNVLIGANGAGKSNFVGVFTLLHEILNGRLATTVAKAGGADRLLHFGIKETPAMRLALSFKNGRKRNGYELRLDAASEDMLKPTVETVLFWDKAQGFPQPFEESIVNHRQHPNEAAIGTAENPIADYVRKHIDSYRVYHFHDTSFGSALRRTANVDDNRVLRPDGSNLAAFLYRLQEKQPQPLESITHAVQQVAPFFGGFHLAPRALKQETIRLEWRHKHSSRYFDVDSLSDGTLRFIALATLLLQPRASRPKTILIDEPELGLHPAALSMFAAMVKSITATQALGLGPQVILATQSPHLLDQFEPEDVIVADLEEGATTFRRLEAGPLKVWLEDYSLGQMWEKNEFGGRPVFG
jgi:predicted ATPase